MSVFFPLYIDPGTGSMLFSILIGVVSTLVFLGRRLVMRLKFIISGGRAERISSAKIPYVIFSDHKRYWNVFKPVCDEFERRGVELAYWTASPDDPALAEGYRHVKCEFIGEGNKAFARLNMMNAGIVLATTPGLDVYQWKRSKNVDWYAHILHMAGDPTTYRMFGLDFYDAVLLTGPYQLEQVRTLEELRGIPRKELLVVGCTYMDGMKVRLDGGRNAGALAEKATKTVLLAPSWGESGILAKYGAKIIDALLATGYTLVIRPHPQSFVSEKELMDSLLRKYPDGDKLRWNRDNDNFAALDESDILITDFSGIIFDYALVFNKPLIYADTAFNAEPYDAVWIDEPLWTFKVLGDIGVRLEESDFPRMKEVIDGALGSSELREGRERVRNDCWAQVGRSAELTVDYLIKKQASLKENLPQEAAAANA